MSHDTKCELGPALESLSQRLEITDKERVRIRALVPSLCFCHARRTTPGWEPNMENLVNLGRRMATEIATFRELRDCEHTPPPAQVELGMAFEPNLQAGREGKVIHVDFEKRRRINSSEG